jgi:hypothetical protein
MILCSRCKLEICGKIDTMGAWYMPALIVVDGAFWHRLAMADEVLVCETCITQALWNRPAQPIIEIVSAIPLLADNMPQAVKIKAKTKGK